MPINKEALKSTLISKTKTYCQYCTLHGVNYLYKSTSWSARVLWTMVLASTMALCCFLGHMIWEKFVIDPTLTVVETTHYSMINIPFPAVTICDTESVYMPNTKNITQMLTLRGYNLSQINEFYDSFSGIKRKGYTPEPFVRKMHSLLEDLGYPWKSLLNMFKRPCNDIAVECNWRSRPHNCSQMFRSVYTIVGYCCQFDIPYFMQNVDVDTNFISGLDYTEALDIVVKGQSSNGYSALYVYDYDDKVTLVSTYISLTPDSYFDVNVYIWTIESSDYVKALPISERKCILESEKVSGASFYQGCMTHLILNKVVNRCRCLPFDFTAQELIVEDYPKCSWEHLICIYQAIDMVEVDIKDIVSDSECFQRCDYVDYDSEVEFIKDQRNLKKKNESLSRVLVHFGQNTCIKYKREVLYTWDQMLANLGGIFGLCIGGSMISIIEIVWFLIEMLITLLGSLCTKRVTPEKKNNKIFVVSKKYEKKLEGKYKFVN